jgi:RNA methyltransferase, TrmH family
MAIRGQLIVEAQVCRNALHSIVSTHMSTEIESRLRRVTSRQNATLKDLRRGFHQAELTGDGHAAIESVRLIEEAIRSGLRFKAVVFSDSGRARAERLLSQISANTEAIIVDDATFASAVDTESPQGVAALVKVKAFTLDDVLPKQQGVVLVAAGLQDPGNLGTMIRSAEAFGASGILTTEGTVATWNSKVVRASVGSVFRLPIVSMKSTELVTRLRERGLRLLATSSHKGTPISQAALTGAIAVCIGNEGAGLPRELSRAVDETLVIPHSERVESLNAGIAASIILYEAARQRA